MSIAASNSAVEISTRALIDLRRLAEGLTLDAVQIRALQGGQHLSRFRGRGMEFEEARVYQPGDDIRNLDWRVTARTGTAHTKIYREEKERPVLLFVDYRQSMFFATRGVFKSVLAARAAALIAWAANQGGDRIGGLLFNDSGHVEIRPKRNKKAVPRFLNTLARHAVWREKTTAAEDPLAMQHALGRLRRVTRPGSLVFLISDFSGLNEQAEKHLRNLAQHNDLVLLFVFDPLERELPPPGHYRVSDGRDERVLHTRDADLRRRYRQRYEDHRDKLEGLCRGHRMHFIPCETKDDVAALLRARLCR